MSEETSPEVRVASPTHVQVLLAVVAALALGFAAGRLGGGATQPRVPPGLQQARQPPSDDSPVVLEVAGQVLTLDQFRARWEQLPLETRRFHAQRGGPEHFLEEIAEEFLLAEEAVARGYAGETGLLERVRRETNRSLVRPLLADEVREKAIPDRELQARFELRRDEWERPARVRTREIRVTPEASPPGATAEDDALNGEEAEAKARRLHARLLAGEDFATLAGRYSEAPSARYGGLIGWVVAGRLAFEYEETALGLAVGSFSEPLAQADGSWVLLLAETREEAGTVAFADHREELLDDLLEEDPGAVSRRYRVFVEEVKGRHEYRVDPEPVRRGFDDSSAR